jgi:hypothetical protein
MDIPTLDVSDPANPRRIDLNGDEYVGRAYLFWTPHAWLALSAEYQYERFEREIPLIEEAEKTDTHSVPLGIRFFHPSGLSAGLTGTYYDQDGDFLNFNSGQIESGSDDFFLVDAAINYRLPKRYGFITVGASNLFDEEFKYFDWEFKNPRIQPERVIFGRVTIALP